MYIKHSLILNILLLGMAACASPKSDLDQLCSVARQVLQDEQITTPPTKAQAMHMRFNPRSQEIKNTWEAIAQVAPRGRWQALKQAAHDVGYSSWECPELEEYWNEPQPRSLDGAFGRPE